MTRRLSLSAFAIVAVASLSFALAQQGQQQNQQQPPLPPGWTQEDMQACIEAGTPGEQQKFLMESAGVWEAKGKSWMAPGMDPIDSESTATLSPMMDGRHLKMELDGEMPGMGPFTGFAIYSYDNVAKKFQAFWVDNMSTGQMIGTGERSTDGKTLTWTYHYMCPINKKETTMREVETYTGKDSRKLEMFAIDPKSGKEFKTMELTLTRKGSSPTGSAR